MIYGIGTDIVKIERMKSLCDNGSVYRCFTEGEIEHCRESRNFYETAAGIFAAKEALAKALGESIVTVLKNTEIRYEEGKPFFGQSKISEGKKINLSVSHDGEYAVAFVVTEVE